MNNKKLAILGVITSFFLAFVLHFIYDKFPSFITSIIAPVNESIAEHMKILFGSIFISGIIKKIIIKVKKLKINNTYFASFISALLSIPIFLIIYMPIYNLIGENFIITITIMLITIIISQIISYLIMKKNDLECEKLAVILTIIVYLIFGFLTHFPPKTKLFIDPLDNKITKNS